MRVSRFAFAIPVLLIAASVFGQDVPLQNWSAPETWSPVAHGLTPVTNANETTVSPMPMFAVPPCRVADTRTGYGFTGPYGPPSLAPTGSRNFTISGQCGIPGTAKAVSFNFTIVNPSAGGWLTLWPAGGTAPNASTMNWSVSTGMIANAAILPLSGAGAISAALGGGGSADLIIDVNGYFYDSANGTLAMPAGKAFQIAANNSGDYAGLFSNQATGGSTKGVGGWTMGQNGAAGVFGHARAAIGVNYGVYGRNDSGTALATGVYGQTTAAGGSLYGVTGTSPGGLRSAGVRGMVSVSIQNDTWSYAGVRGESDVFGVLGVTTSGTGVGGFVHDGTGAVQSGSYLGYTSTVGLHTIGNTEATGVKNFVEPYPGDPQLVIRYASLEGNEAGTYFRGRGHFSNGAAVVNVPEDFRMVTDTNGLSIQVTPIGDFANVAVVSIDLNRVVLKGSRDVEFFYTVNGIRRSYRDFQPVQHGQEFVPRSPDDTMPAAYAPEIRRRLIENGTYNSDGTVNIDTAERMGWAQKWRDAQARQKQ